MGAVAVPSLVNVAAVSSWSTLCLTINGSEGLLLFTQCHRILWQIQFTMKWVMFLLWSGDRWFFGQCSIYMYCLSFCLLRSRWGAWVAITILYWCQCGVCLAKVGVMFDERWSHRSSIIGVSVKGWGTSFLYSWRLILHVHVSIMKHSIWQVL